VPAADPLARILAEKANERGAAIDVRPDFAAVCREINEQLSHEQLQEIASEVVLEREIVPTAMLRLLARVLSRKLLTSNYDDATERSIDAVGLTPRRIGPKDAAALREPEEGEVFVIHVHGLAEEASSIVLPGASLDALADDEAFLNWLRGVLAPHTVLYLGYRFPPEDDYLPGELRWLAHSLIGTGTHALLLPAHEYTGEARARLDELEGANFSVFTFDAARNYEAVQQAGLVVAPAQQVVSETVEARVAHEMKPYFRPPLILPEDPSVDREQWGARVMAARWG
jgi:SIR2-like domain